MNRFFIPVLLILITSCNTEKRQNNFDWIIFKISGNCLFAEPGCLAKFQPDKLIFYCEEKTVATKVVSTTNRIVTNFYAGKQVFEISYSGDSVMILTEKYKSTPIEITLYKNRKNRF